MQAAMASCLEAAGADVTLAYYQPFRLSPELSVPFWRLGQRKPERRKVKDRHGRDCIEIGVWLPEIEAMRYRATRLWRETLKEFDAFVAVCGTVFAARPSLDAGLPTLAWVATPYDADRAGRAGQMRGLRALFDRLIDRPLCRRLERRLLRQGRMLALSDYTCQALRELQPEANLSVLPFPIDTDLFNASNRTDPLSAKQVKVGVVGRLDDPRKNLRLLLEALALLKDSLPQVTASLVGIERRETWQALIDTLELADRVELQGLLPHAQLCDYYRSLDILVIPSLQEGLCLVGLEAMACGTPVIATRCGGPEDYIEDGVTGILIANDAGQLAAAIAKLVTSPDWARGLAKRGSDLVKSKYTRHEFARRLLAELSAACGVSLAVPDKW